MKRLLLLLSFSFSFQSSSHAATVYDLSREFSVVSNPNEAWTYGVLTNIGGGFTAMNSKFTAAGANGVPIAGWSLSGGLPNVFKNVGTDTATSDGGAGLYPPGTIKFQPTDASSPARFAVARFTVPADGAGSYHIETTARAYLDGPSSGDTDFHVVYNGDEIFGVFLPGNGATGYTNDLVLAPGDTVDFVTGPGADQSAFGSGLKVTARITTQCQPVTNVVVVTNTIVVTNTSFFTNNVSLATMQDGITSAQLSRANTRPLLASVRRMSNSLERLSVRVERKIGPVNPDLSAEIQSWITQLIGLPLE